MTIWKPRTRGRSQVLHEIRVCGRLADEGGARGLYLKHGIGLRAYREAYCAGLRERVARRKEKA